MGLGTAYLVVFNFVLAAGWGAVLVPLVQAVIEQCDAGSCVGLLPFGAASGDVCVCGDLHAQVEQPLKIFQTAAVLEVLHALTGLVRAPVFTTVIQVLSRQVLLWAIVVPFEATHTMPRFATMLLAWSVTEVIRYSFYGFALVLGAAPYPLVWLRYTLFFVLYPLGVGSELALITASLDELEQLGYRTLFIWIMVAYLPGFPLLYTHMIAQRAKVIGGKGRPKRKEAGVVFPPGKKGDRSTTAAGKEAFAAAVAGVDAGAAEKVRKEKNWRFGYGKHILEQVRMCSQSGADCVKIADAGLKHLHENFELIRGDKTMKLSEAAGTIRDSFEIGVLEGKKPKPSEFKCLVPYAEGYSLMEPCVTDIEGQVLLDQLAKWADAGVIEASACDAISSVVKNQVSAPSPPTPSQFELAFSQLRISSTANVVRPLRPLRRPSRRDIGHGPHHHAAPPGRDRVRRGHRSPRRLEKALRADKGFVRHACLPTEERAQERQRGRPGGRRRLQPPRAAL